MAHWYRRSWMEHRKGCTIIKAALLTVGDVSRGTVDWLLVDDPLLLDLGIFRIPGLRIAALRSEHQHGLMVLMVLSQGTVCGQYVATELAMCWNGGAGVL